MKKYLLFLLVAVLGFGFTSCKKQPEAKVKVTVLNNLTGEPVDGKTVYLFDAATWNSTLGRTVGQSIANSNTDPEGIATITLSGFKANLYGPTFYVAFFDGKGVDVLDNKVVELKPGDYKEVTLNPTIL